MSLVAGLAGALGMVAVAAAAPRTDTGGVSGAVGGAPIQIAAAYGLGPSVSHDEMAAPVGSGLVNLIEALTTVLPTAGPGTKINPVGGETVGDRVLASDAAEGANTSLRYLCPDRLYRSDNAWSNHVNANCGSGGADLLPRDTVPTLVFAKLGPLPPSSSPPGGSPIPLPCGGTALSFYTSSVANSVSSNVRVSNTTIH